MELVPSEVSHLVLAVISVKEAVDSPVETHYHSHTERTLDDITQLNSNPMKGQSQTAHHSTVLDNWLTDFFPYITERTLCAYVVYLKSS